MAARVSERRFFCIVFFNGLCILRLVGVGMGNIGWFFLKILFTTFYLKANNIDGIIPSDFIYVFGR